MTHKIFASYQMQIHTLGKIHVGTGNDMDPTNYVMAGNRLYEFPVDALATVFSLEERQTLLQYVSKSGSADMVRNVQRLIYRQRAQLRAHAAYAPMFVCSGIAELYRRNMEGKSTHHNALEIQRTYRNPNTGLPTLPGSSIKGAIRTALLNQRNQGRSARPRTAARDLEKELFQYTSSNFHQDPMRLIHIADAESLDAQNAPATSVVFAVNRKKESVQRQGKEVQSMAENLYQMLEVVNDRQVKKFHSHMTLHKIDGIAAPEDQVPRLRFTATQIAEACNSFYGPLWDQEIEQLQQREFVDPKWCKDAGHLRSLVEKNPRLFLLRIGHHSGAEAVTIQGVRDIRIMQGRGKKPRFAEASGTWWLAANQQKDRHNLIPFGWVVAGLTENAD